MTDTFQDEAQIRSILDDAAKALYAKDADAMVAHYADDIVVANLAPPLRNKASEGRNKGVLEQWFDTGVGRSISNCVTYTSRSPATSPSRTA